MNKRLMSIASCFIGTFPQCLLHLFLKLNPQYFDYLLIVLHLSSQGTHARLRLLQLHPQIADLFLTFFHFHLPFLILADQLEYLFLFIHWLSSLESLFGYFVLQYHKSLKFFSFLLNLSFQAFVFIFVFLCLSFYFGNLCFEDEDFILILLKFFLRVTQCFFQVYGHFLILFLVSFNILELQQSLIFETHQLFIFESSFSIFRAKLPVKILPLLNLFSQLQILLLESLYFGEESIDSSLLSHRYKQ